MRIAIAGASGTGKTTLARAISEKYNIPLNPIGARSVALEMGFDNPYDVDKAGKRVEFQKRLFEAKRDWELAHEDFVTDRSYLDNLTYCALHMASDLEQGAIDTFTAAMRRYDLLFWLPSVHNQRLDDGIRQTNTEYHRMYELILWQLVLRADQVGDLGIVRQPGGSLETRLESAFEDIQEICGR